MQGLAVGLRLMARLNILTAIWQSFETAARRAFGPEARVLRQDPVNTENAVQAGSFASAGNRSK